MCVKQLSMSSLGDSQVTTDSLFANRHTALFEHGGTLCSHTWPLSTMLYCWAFTAFMLSLSLISAAICTAHTVHFTGFFSFFQQASSYRHGKAAFYPSLARVTLVWWPPHCSSGSFATGPITRQNSHSDRNVHGDFVRLEYAYFQAICSANAHNIALLHKAHSNIVSKTTHTYCLLNHIITPQKSLDMCVLVHIYALYFTVIGTWRRSGGAKSCAADCIQFGREAGWCLDFMKNVCENTCQNTYLVCI